MNLEEFFALEEGEVICCDFNYTGLGGMHNKWNVISTANLEPLVDVARLTRIIGKPIKQLPPAYKGEHQYYVFDLLHRFNGGTMIDHWPKGKHFPTVEIVSKKFISPAIIRLNPYNMNGWHYPKEDCRK